MNKNVIEENIDPIAKSLPKNFIAPSEESIKKTCANIANITVINQSPKNSFVPPKQPTKASEIIQTDSIDDKIE